MPWRGPRLKGEFPTLGYLVGDWIEANLTIPDGPRRGQPFQLTPEQWRFLLHFYRLRPDAPDDAGPDAFVYYGAQLVRPQKWGKDPLAAALHCVEALGPVVFAGWSEDGEPLGRPWATPWQQCAATAEEQTANTFRPIVAMLRDSGLDERTPGLDVGETRVKLPAGDGWIEPVTASARARLGARLTFATFTESHLMCESDGGLALARAMKRNLAGMGGRWVEITNAWDPSQGSVAQRTYEAKAPGVYLDYRPPRTVVDLDDDQAVLDELRYVYGDSIASRGGWVSETRILAEIRNEATGEAEARRYFLNEVRVGSTDFTDPIRWAALARADDPLRPGEAVALGFDGSRSRDSTVLSACRIRDGRHFFLRRWVPADYDSSPGAGDGIVPRDEVDKAVTDAFDAFDVWYLVCDPYRWQEYVAKWAGRWPRRVIEFPTNAEIRMDAAIERVLTDIESGDLTHDGAPEVTEHVLATALTTGNRKPAREDGTRHPRDRYLHLVPKKQGMHIDATVALCLAREGRARALEDGALTPKGPVQLDGPLMV